MDLKMFLVVAAFLLHTALGFPIQENYGNGTATTEPTEVGTEHTEAATESTEVGREPTEAATEPTKAATEPTKAATEPTKAATEPTKAATEPTKAATEPTKAATEPTEVGTERTEVGREPTKAATESTKAATESTKAATESTKAATESTKAATESTKAATESTKAATESTKAATESTKAGTEPTEKATESTEAATEPTKVSTREDTYESPSPTETDSEDEIIFNRILEANKDSSQFLQEGDIVPQRRRSAINCRHCNWPQSSDGIVRVPYVLDPTYEESHVRGILDAMAEFEALTCVNFVKRKTERDYLNIKSADGCWSNYGKVGGGQTVSVMKGGCMWKGIIQHELEHALGFLHEHSRSDRDEYVRIMWEYISPSDRPDFKKFENSRNLGLPYDYSSVMHYGPYTFSNTTGKATIVPIPDGSVHIGQRQGMSNLDVAKINKLYNCSRCSTILDSASGSLRSANHPRNYSDNTNCVWLIRTRSRKVSLHFQAFELQETRGCQGDYIKVYDGSSKSSAVLMDKTCGSKIPNDIVASSNHILVEFVTDGADTASGFQATFASVRIQRKPNVRN